jgi:hypothetical protein
MSLPALQPKLKIHAALAVRLGKCAGLYYYLRSLWSGGRSSFEFNVSEAMRVLGLNKAQFKYQLERLMELGCFWQWHQRGKDIIHVSFVSYKRTMAQLELPIGSCIFDIPNGDLGEVLLDIHNTAIEAQAVYSQERAEKAAFYRVKAAQKPVILKDKTNRGKEREQPKKEVSRELAEKKYRSNTELIERLSKIDKEVTDNTIMRSVSLRNCCGIISHIIEKGFLFVHDSYRVPVVSQSNIAKQLGCSLKTVSRKLKDVQKVRIAYYTKENQSRLYALNAMASKLADKYASFTRENGSKFVVELAECLYLSTSYKFRSSDKLKRFLKVAAIV